MAVSEYGEGHWRIDGDEPPDWDRPGISGGEVVIEPGEVLLGRWTLADLCVVQQPEHREEYVSWTLGWHGPLDSAEGVPGYTTATVTTHRVVWHRRFGPTTSECGQLRFETASAFDRVGATSVDLGYRAVRGVHGPVVHRLRMALDTAAAADELHRVAEHACAVYQLRRLAALGAGSETVATLEERVRQAAAREVRDSFYGAHAGWHLFVQDDGSPGARSDPSPDFDTGLRLADGPPWPEAPAEARDLASTDSRSLPRVPLTMGVWLFWGLQPPGSDTLDAYPVVDQDGRLVVGPGPSWQFTEFETSSGGWSAHGRGGGQLGFDGQHVWARIDRWAKVAIALGEWKNGNKLSQLQRDLGGDKSLRKQLESRTMAGWLPVDAITTVVTSEGSDDRIRFVATSRITDPGRTQTLAVQFTLRGGATVAAQELASAIARQRLATATDPEVRAGLEATLRGEVVRERNSVYRDLPGARPAHLRGVPDPWPTRFGRPEPGAAPAPAAPPSPAFSPMPPPPPPAAPAPWGAPSAPPPPGPGAPAQRPLPPPPA